VPFIEKLINHLGVSEKPSNVVLFLIFIFKMVIYIYGVSLKQCIQRKKKSIHLFWYLKNTLLSFSQEWKSIFCVIHVNASPNIVVAIYSSCISVENQTPLFLHHRHLIIASCWNLIYTKIIVFFFFINIREN